MYNLFFFNKTDKGKIKSCLRQGIVKEMHLGGRK